MFKATIMIPEVCRHGHFPLYLDTLFNIAGHYMLFAIICCMLTCSKFSYKHHVSSVDVNPVKKWKKINSQCSQDGLETTQAEGRTADLPTKFFFKMCDLDSKYCGRSPNSAAPQPECKSENVWKKSLK